MTGVITVIGQSLVAVNAKTGQHYPDFGGGGYVDLTKGLDRPIKVIAGEGRLSSLVT